MGDRSLRRAFVRDVAAAGLPVGPGPNRPVDAGEIESFDEPVRRYLGFMRVVGRPRVWSFGVRFTGRFRMRPDGPWMPAVALQYSSVIDIARVFTMRLRFAGAVPMIGHDMYVRGTGRMVGRIARLVTVADGSGTEFDIGELTTWLNDAVLLAPSMLLSAPVTWRGLDERSFKVVLTDAGRTARAVVTIDERGAPTDFATMDRWAAMPHGLVRARWRTPVPGWTATDDDLPVPLPGGAVWDLPDGPFSYVEGGFEPSSLQRNVPPPTH